MAKTRKTGKKRKKRVSMSDSRRLYSDINEGIRINLAMLNYYEQVNDPRYVMKQVEQYEAKIKAAREAIAKLKADAKKAPAQIRGLKDTIQRLDKRKKAHALRHVVTRLQKVNQQITDAKTSLPSDE